MTIHSEGITPTDDEREALETVIARVWANYSEQIGPTDAEVTAAILAAGFRRSEVPEPSAEGDEFAQDECDGSGTCPARRHIHGCYTVHRADQCDSPDEYGHLPPEPQGEPSDAQLLAQGFRDGVDYIDDQPGPWGAAVVAGRAEAARRVAAAGGLR
mgnify:CR=1 FL=1